MKKLYHLLIIALAFGSYSSLSAQVTTNGGMGLSATYPDLATAISDLNGVSPVTQPVVISLNGSELAPSGGYVITATATTGSILIQQLSSGSVVMAGLQVAGKVNDAVFKIVGGDKITIKGFTIVENPSNFSVPADLVVVSNKMTEFGIAIYGANTTDGAKDNVIDSNEITLNPSYSQSIAILSTSTFSSDNSATGGVAPPVQTALAGGENSNNKILRNIISDVSYGIIFVAPSATTSFSETGNDIGGSSAATGNTINSAYTVAFTTAYPGFPTLAAGNLAPITLRGTINYSVRFNSIQSSINLTGTAILSSAAAVPAVGVAYTNTISNNTINFTNNSNNLALTGIDFGYGNVTGAIIGSNNNITLNQSATGVITTPIIGIKSRYPAASFTHNNNTIVVNQTIAGPATNTNNCPVTGIQSGGSATATTGTNTFNGNTITIRQNSTGGVYNGGGAINYIDLSGTTFSGTSIVRVNNNNLNTSGSSIREHGLVAGINHSTTIVSNLEIDGNTIFIERLLANAFILIGHFGIYTTTATNPNFTLSVTNNNITILGGTSNTAASIIGIVELDGDNNINSKKTITGNVVTISTPSVQSANVKGIEASFGSGLSSVTNYNNFTISNNTINVSSFGVMTGIHVSTTNTTTNLAPPAVITGNTLTLTSGATTASGTMNGILVQGTVGADVYSNTFTSLAFNNNTTANPFINVINLQFGGNASNPHRVYNNTIQNTFTNAGSGSVTVNGILVSTNVSRANIYKNKIYGLSASTSGATTTVTAINVQSSGGIVNVHNNLIGLDNNTNPRASNIDAIRGISFPNPPAALTTYNVHYNTIFINATSVATNFGSSGIYHTGSATATSGQLNMANNIIVNNSVPNGTGRTVAFRRDANGLANYQAVATNNNNLFYAGPSTGNYNIYFDGTTAQATLALYKAAVGPLRDAASVTENPTFLSTIGTNPGFLKINTAVGTLAESGGLVLGAPFNVAPYLTDFEEEARSASTPDIGADEFVGICPPPTALPTNFSMGTYSGTSYTGTFTAASPAPSGGYLVVRTTTNVQPVPTGNSYVAGTLAPIGFIEAIGNFAATSPFVSTVPAGAYYYWVFAYNNCVGGNFSYSARAVSFLTAPCPAPAVQPTALVLTPLSPSSISGSFTPASGVNGYVVIRTATNTAPTPVDGTTYTAGTSAAGGFIESVGTGTSFTSTSLSGSTTYYYWVFSYNDGCFAPRPRYNLVNPLTSNATTPGCPKVAPLINTVGPTGDFSNITGAVAYLQGCPLLGNDYIFELQSNYTSSTETFPIVITRLSSGTNNHNSVTFRPATGATSLITSSNPAGTLVFSGVPRVVFDGRAGGSALNPYSLTIQNSFVGPSFAIQFEGSLVAPINGATNNTVRYCNIRSSNNATSGGGGTINFATSIGGSGNSSNLIEYNNIFDAGTGTATPTVAIYSNGSPSFVNTTNTISNNNIYNYFNKDFAHSGIVIAGGSNNWTINNNSFYQTATRNITTAGAIHAAISVNTTSVGSVTIQNNFVGGTGPNASTPSGSMTITGNGILRAIQLNSSNTAAGVTLTGNTVKNINFTSSNSSGTHSLVYLSGGVVDAGAAAGNILGDQSSNGSVQVTLSDNNSGVGFSGIYAQTLLSTDAITLINNSIGGITLSGTSTAATLSGINFTGNNGQVIIRQNTVGSNSQVNSLLNNLNTSVYGILGNSSSSSTQSIFDNTVSNVSALNSGTSSVATGIYVQGSATYNIGQFSGATAGNTIVSVNSAGSNSFVYNAAGIVNAATGANQLITKTTVSNVTSTAASTNYGVVGINISNASTAAVSRNFIHSLDITGTNEAAYITGIQADAGTSVFSNNMIRLGINNTGASITRGFNIYGLVDNGGINSFHFNSVYIGGSGVVNTPSGFETYAFYGYNGGAKDVRNNILWNARSNASGSSPSHSAIYLSNNSGATNITNNDLIATGTGGRIGSFGGTGYITLTDWKAGSGTSAISFSSLPGFVNPTAAVPDLHINSTVLSVVDQGGSVLAAPTVDFDNDLRSSFTPHDIGADAVILATAPSKVDFGIANLASPAASFGCYSSAEPLIVSVKNFSTSALNFSTTQVTLTVNISGPITTTINYVIPAATPSLAAGASTNITLPGTLNMTTFGTYNFNITFSLASPAVDEDYTNDVFSATRSAAAVSVGIATSSPVNYCGSTGGAPTLTLSSVAGGSIQWKVSTVFPYVWTDATGPSANSISYNAPSISSTTYYYAEVKCGATTVSSNIVSVLVSNPQVLTGPAATITRCGPGVVALNGTTSAGSQLVWFDALTGGSLLATGNAYTPNLSVTQDIYYTAQSLGGVGAISAPFGTATTTNTTTGFPAPYTNWFGGTKHQMLIRASELIANGVTPGNITSVTFTVQSVGSTFTGTLQNFQINMAQTAVATLNGAAFEPATTVVYGPVNQSIPSSGDVTHTFTTPFAWDGVSNLIIQTSYSNGNFGASTDNVQMMFSSQTFTSTTFYRRDLQTSAAILGSAVPDGASTNRPNMKLGFVQVCYASGARIKTTAVINAQPTPISVTPSATTVCGTAQLLTKSGGTVTATGLFNGPVATVNGALPDFSGGVAGNYISPDYPVSVPVGAVIDSVVVTYNITHTFDGDLIINLQGANGQVVNLVNRRGGAGDNFVNTRVSSDATISSNFGAATAPFNGIYKADLATATGSGISLPTTTNTFASLFSSPNGNWRLSVHDLAGVDIGTLLNWSLKIYYKEAVNPVITWTPNGAGNGLFTDAAATTLYTGATTNSVYALPTSTTTYSVTATAPGGCTSSTTVVVTTNTASIAATAVSASPAVICSGAPVTLTQTGGTLGTGAVWRWYTDAAFTTPAGGIPGVGPSATATVNPTVTTTYYLRSEGGTAPCAANVPSAATVTVTINPTNTWLGINNNWLDPLNWCPGLPTSATDITIPTGMSNYPVITAAGPVARNITIAAGASISINGAGVLDVKGNLVNNGTLTNDGTITLTGIAAQTFPGAGGSILSMNRLTINNTSGANPAVTINRSITIDSVITPTAGIVNLNNVFVTLKSTPTRTARVGVAGPTASFTYAGTGNFVVERCYPSVPNRRTWRLVTAPIVQNTSTIFNSWQAGGNNNTPNNATYITGPGANPATNGLDISPLNNFSLKKYDPVNNSFNSAGTGVANTRTALVSNLPSGATGSYLTNNPGYFIFIRGDRSPANTAPYFTYGSVTTTTLRDTGNIKLGNYTYTCYPGSGSSLYTLVGNPYASPVDFSQLTRTNLQNKFWTWDPKLSTTGGYVTVDYTVSPFPLISPLGSTQTGIIQSSQAFLVESSGATPSIGFSESAKATVDNPTVFRPTGNLPTMLSTNLYMKDAAGNDALCDGVVAQFGQQFDSKIDKLDAVKLANINETFSIASNGTYLSIERRQEVNENDTLFYFFNKSRQLPYKLNFTLSNFSKPNLTGIIQDTYLGTEKAMNMAGETWTDFNVTADAASAAKTRFRVVFRKFVTASNIDAAMQYEDVVVNWKVQSEVKVGRYEVERSVDGVRFESIGVKDVADNLPGAAQAWTDQKPATGVYYYRVKCIGENGSYAYTGVAKVNVYRASNDLYVFPNPVINNAVGIHMSKMPSGQYQARILTADGRVVDRSIINHTAGAPVDILKPSTTLIDGAYQLEVIGTDKKRHMVKIIVKAY